MPVAIRPRGIGLVITAIILFALAGFTRVGWLLLFDAVLWGAILVSAIMPWLAAVNLNVRRSVSAWNGKGEYPGPMEGEDVELEIVLENRGFLPCMFVSLIYGHSQSVEFDRQRLFVAWLGRGERYVRHIRVRFNSRGLHRLPQAKIETSVPFGIFRRSRRMGEGSEVLVLPRVYSIGRLELLDNTGSDSFQSLRARVGEQTAGSRGFVSGDPWHHIHWRNTARMAQPQVREFEKTPDSALTIAFDSGRLGQNGGNALEEAIRIAASAGDHVCRTGGSVRLLTGIRSDETMDSNYLLRTLALLRPTRDGRPPALASLIPPFAATLIVLKDTDAGGMREAVRLAASQRRVTVVLLRQHDNASTPHSDAAELLKSGARVVECSPGGAAEAVALLDTAQTGGYSKSSLVMPDARLRSPREHD